MSLSDCTIFEDCFLRPLLVLLGNTRHSFEKYECWEVKAIRLEVLESTRSHGTCFFADKLVSAYSAINKAYLNPFPLKSTQFVLTIVSKIPFLGT